MIYRVFGNNYNTDGTLPRHNVCFTQDCPTLDQALALIKRRLDTHTTMGSIEVTQRDPHGSGIAEVRLQFGFTQHPPKVPEFVRNYGNKAFLHELKAKWNTLVGM